MDIKKELDGTTLTVYVAGRLDTLTAPQLDESLEESINGVDKLILDLAETEFLSSAGLRVVLEYEKLMHEKGGLVIRNVCSGVMDVFRITGFAQMLTIE